MRLVSAAFASAFLGLLSIGISADLRAQVSVRPVFSTPELPAGNVDSCAVWVPEDGAPDSVDPLLFVTEKDGDRIEVWLADTGEPYEARLFLGGAVDSSLPGEFNRPNGVWVIYHVPFAGGFADVLIVTDQTNQRVQLFRLPELEYFGELGAGEVGKGYGIASYQDGTDSYVWITDNIPPAGSPGKIKKYRLRPEGDGIGADLVLAFGSSSGTPPLPNVESIVADLPNGRLHVCGDEGGQLIRIFGLDGTYSGTVYGEPQFEYDQEGINLYETGRTTGYLVVSDQYRSGSPNQFEIFDRLSLAPLGNFIANESGPWVTTNTDGAYLEQRGFRGFPNGAFYAVHNDRSVHAYDWTTIAEAMELEIVPLDRSFPGGSDVAAGPTRTALWFHDGSWWGALPRSGRTVLSRLESGTFVGIDDLGPAGEAMVRSLAEEIVVLVAGEAPTARRLSYEGSSRRYVATSAAQAVPSLEGSIADLAVEGNAIGTTIEMVRVAWVADGHLWTSSSDGGLLDWSQPSEDLGGAIAVAPRFARVGDRLAVAWVDDSGARVRFRDLGEPEGAWSDAEWAPASSVASLAAAGTPEGELWLVAAGADGSAALSTRSPMGAWTTELLEGAIRDPALLVDASAGEVHLVYAVADSDVGGDGARRRIVHRVAELAALSFSEAELLCGWPGVSQTQLLVPQGIPETAPQIIVASMGDDDRGYVGRIQLPPRPDRIAPITFEHDPPPGADGVAPEATVSFRVADEGEGIDRLQLSLFVDGAPVSPSLRGSTRNLLASWPLPAGVGPEVSIRIEAVDLATPSNVMAPFEYSFWVGEPLEDRFRRGDGNEDGVLDISDAVRTLLVLFSVAEEPSCLDALDSNDDGLVDVGDPVTTLRHLFLQGPALPAPGPVCGPGPTPDALACASSPSCP